MTDLKECRVYRYSLPRKQLTNCPFRWTAIICPDHPGPGVITYAELQSLWPESSEIEKVEASSSVDISTNTPDEIMDRSFQLLQSQLTDEVLDSVKGVSPESFERLVNRLLAHMGYGEIDRETGHSGDQGYRRHS